MLHWSQLDPLDTLYTFVDGDTGENCDLASERLRQWCLRTLPAIVHIPVRADWVCSFMRDGAINQARLCALHAIYTKGVQMEPIIFCMTDNRTHTGMMVDGHHRYVVAYLEKHRSIMAHTLSRAEWHPFRVSGLPSVTEKELVSEPAIGFRKGLPSERAK